MNILLVSGPEISLREPFNSGIEAFLVSFAGALCRAGHSVNIIAAEADPTKTFRLINPFRETANENLSAEDLAQQTADFLKIPIGDYDIIHYNMFYPHLFIDAEIWAKKSVLTLHSPPDERRIAVFKKLMNTGNFTFVAISERLRAQYGRDLGAGIQLINNGIDLDIWSPAQQKDPQYLLWSARITEEKNPAAAVALAQYLDLPLMIAGRIVNQHYFDAEIKPHLGNKIKYLGHLNQQEIRLLTKNAMAFLATATWQEPFGLAALEMLACGVPVVGFRTAVPQDWHSKCVLTTSTQRWHDLAPLVHKSQNVRASVCRDFASKMTVQRMTDEYISLYNSILDKEKVYLKVQYKITDKL